MLNDNQYINSVWEKYYKAESQARENQKYSYRFYKKEKSLCIGQEVATIR